MENTRHRRSGGLRKVITAVFAVAFVASIISTVTAFAAANLFKIENAELSELSATAEGSISSFDETNIVSNVTFHKLNDSAKYTITLKNTDDKDHVIESITDDNESPYISYIYDQHANEQINAGENLVFEVTAKYTTAITDIDQRAQATNVRFFIHFTDLEEEIPIVPNTGVNPNTGDFIHFSVISLIISAAGLTIIGIIALKKHKKASKFIAAGIVAVAAIATTATVKAVTTEINSIALTSNYGFYDKLIINVDGEDVIIDYGDKLEDIDEIEDPTNTGHTFTGWEDEDGNPVDPTAPITDDLKIRPTFRAHTYTIKFNGNGATGSMTDLAMTYGESKQLPANAFTFAGREYTGWDTTPNGSGAHYDNVATVENLTAEDNAIVTLYAQWSVNPFHIDYDGNGATSGEMATTNCEYDQACELRENAFEKYGYDFAGWKYNDTAYRDKADVTNIIESGTITMQAQWTPHVYTITYTGLTSEEATTLRTAGNPDTYTIESPSFTLKNPEDRKDADGDTRQHFIGWREITEPSTTITLPVVSALSDKTYEAMWQDVALPEYDITYNYDHGTVATANPEKLTKEQSATLNEPVKTGYTFTGWTGTAISGDTPVKPYTIPAPHQKGNLEYTAHYQAHTYTVNFDINTDDTHVSGTMQPLTFSYDEEKALTANAFTRTGYTFAGWKLGDDEYTNGQTVKNLTAEDGATVTLKAQWTPNQFIINYHANDASATGVMLPQVVTYDEQTTLHENNFALDHYKYMGWATSENGAVAYADQADVTNAVSEANGTLDLYAVWLERTSTLDTGSNVNAALRDLTAAPTTFKRFDGENLPDFDALDGKVDIALASSNFPVWAWADGDTIYWWSEAEAPKLNDQSNGFFTGRTKLSNNQYEDNSLKNLTTIDMTGLDVSTATNMNSMFAYESNLETLNLGDFNAASAKTMSSMFINTTSLKNLDLSKFESPAAIDMSSMFYGSGVTSLDLSQIESSTVTNMTNMFYGVKMDSLDASKLNTSSATTMDGMFRSATIGSLKFYDQENPSASLFDTSNVQTMNNMFSSTNTATIDVSNFNTSKVTSLSGTFSRTTASTINVAGWNTSKVTNMTSTFLGVTLADLNLSHFNTAQVTTMQQMFDDATIINLNLSGWTNDRVTNMSYMFRNFGRFGSNELHIDFTNFKTPALKSMFHMFDGYAAMNLKVLDLSSFDTSNVTNMQYAFGSTESNAGVRVFDTIYASDKFVVSDAIGDNITVFGRNGHNGHNLIGGAGTVWNDANPKTKEYARIDDPCNDKPGYFTLKDHQYICFHANNGTDARKGQYVSTTASDQLDKNEFTHEGFRFLGWAESDDATAPLYTDEAAITLAYIGKEPKNLYAVWEAIYLQDYDKENLGALLPNEGDSLKFFDKRDNQLYTVKKLADGNFWMTENLRIAGKTITSDDSNLPDGESFTIAPSNIMGFGSSLEASAAYVSNDYGGYYNYYTATAGWGTEDKTSGNSPQDICPKGWRLPTGSSGGDFDNLYRNHYNSKELLMGVPALTDHGGVIVNGVLKYADAANVLLSSTIDDNSSDSALIMEIDAEGDSVFTATFAQGRINGINVRCMAK